MSRPHRRSLAPFALGLAWTALAVGVAPGTDSPTVSAATPRAIDPVLGYDPADTTTMAAISTITGARRMWAAGYTGQGIDIAVIDTGVARVPGLDAPGKVVDGPDLSFDSTVPSLVTRDAFGHGTHMAGIMAGSDVASKGGSLTDPSRFVGIAPGARIVNVKVGAFDGATDVSQVIAAIDWVVQHRNDPGFNIRVLNLSYGTDSDQDPLLDPLVHAVEQAWAAGIVVVVAGGNDGKDLPRVANPAASPAVLSVGATDTKGTLTTTDDTIPEFAQHGNGTRGVDIVAPGTSVVSLRVPNGFVDQNVTTGKVGTRFQRASGTSQATAVVSGLAALVLSKYPKATPAQVKAYLRGAAKKVQGIPFSGEAVLDQHITLLNTWYAGAGSAYVDPSIKLPAAVALPINGTGLGSLEKARGTYHVSNGTKELRGEKDIFGKTWRPLPMSLATTRRTTWIGGWWNSSQWTGTTWFGMIWRQYQWTSNDWSGMRWKSDGWTGMRWKSDGWTGMRWKSDGWSSGNWTGSTWTGSQWSDAGWR